MRNLIASVAAVGLLAGPAIAASSTPAKASSTKTTTTKVTPTASKGKAHAKVKHHTTHSKSAMAHAAHKPAPKSKSSDTTKKS